RNADTYFSDYYIVPWCRMGPYIVGAVTGYILYRTNGKCKINKFLNLILWAVFTTLACLVLFGLHDALTGNPLDQPLATLYLTTHRTVWGACVCWVIFACSTGNGGIINTILSWKAFIPLSRLTYCAYLIHPIVISVYIGTNRQAQIFTEITYTFQFLGILVTSLAVAFILSVTLEAPMMGLEKTLIPKKKKNADTYFSDYYIVPWCRMGPYIVGAVTGYILYRTNGKCKINKFLNLILWAVFTTLACLVLFGLHDALTGNPLDQPLATLYLTTHRTVWGACVCWVIFACSTGNGGIINTILSWKAFIPLSRLTYCAYLIHPIVISVYIGTNRQAQIFTEITYGIVVSLWIVATVLACLVLYGLYDPLNGSPLNQSASTLYLTTHRTIWGACVCWVVFACATGNGGYVNTLLSWKAFIPLSRLTYVAYLVHPIIMEAYNGSLRQPIQLTDLTFMFLFVGYLVATLVISFVVSLAFESPMMGLEKAIFKKKK
ncbi:hypothetical protein FSP39_016609, partial [Pinctada imbricata]